MREELAAEIEPLRSFWQNVDQVPGFALYGWLAELRTPIEALRPEPSEVAEVLWLTAEEAVGHPDAFAGNGAFIAALLEAVG